MYMSPIHIQDDKPHLWPPPLSILASWLVGGTGSRKVIVHVLSLAFLLHFPHRAIERGLPHRCLCPAALFSLESANTRLVAWLQLKKKIESAVLLILLFAVPRGTEGRE